jgi:hypothetical protein
VCLFENRGEEKQFFLTTEKEFSLSLVRARSFRLVASAKLFSDINQQRTREEQEEEGKKRRGEICFSSPYEAESRTGALINVGWVRADARCADETTIGMLFIRSGHDWMMKRDVQPEKTKRGECLMRRFSFFFLSFSALSTAWQMQMDPSF